MKLKLIYLFCIMGMFSCAELQQVVGSSTITIPTTTKKPLTEMDVISGLKQALTIGTDTAVRHLSKVDGYFGNSLYKILLPPEADIIVKNITKVPGGTQLLNNVILSINRSAEDAAKEAAPIFVNAITQMSIQDAWGVLKGADNAATEYLKRTTTTQLFNLYNPKIQSSLNKPLVGNVSANLSWKTLTDQWNLMAKSTVGKISGFTPVNTQLDVYLTNKALDGMFLKIAEEEKQIRKDPTARVTDILKRVFSTN